jgi:hypothetical protein
MAQEQTTVPFYDFMYPRFLLKDLYDIDMQEDDYLERAYNTYRAIGNIATGIHHFKFTVADDLKIELPCNCEFIESVSTDENLLMRQEDLIIYSATNSSLSPNSFLADVISNESLRRVYIPQSSNLHPTGIFMPYDLQGRIMHFSTEQSGTKGNLIYRGILVDDNDNPILYRKEAEAIAAQLAYLHTQKQVFMRDPAAAGILAYIKPEANRLMAAAKIPESITQNQWNRILAARTRHDRKVFNSSYKPVQ